MAEGKLLLVIHLNFLIPTSLQSSGSAITTSGCLPMWNLKTKHSLVLCFYNIYNNKKKRKKKTGIRNNENTPENGTIFGGKKREQVRAMLGKQGKVSYKW